MIVAQGGEFRVAASEAADVRGVTRGFAGGSQVAVTFGAGFFADRGDVDAAAMLGVAGGAVRRGDLAGVMDGAVMASQARLIVGLGGKGRGFLHVARGAFFFQNGVGLGHAAAAVNASVFVKGVPGNPDDGEQRQ